jgi:hypothetical protein
MWTALVEGSAITPPAPALVSKGAWASIVQSYPLLIGAIETDDE